MNNKPKDEAGRPERDTFLRDLGNVMHRHGVTSLYYTNDDDGLHAGRAFGDPWAIGWPDAADAQPAISAGGQEPVLRIYAQGSMRTVTEWLDGARDLPDGDYALYAAPVAAEAAPQAEQQGAGEAPPCWWIDHGTHGQITQRQDEAEAAIAAGKPVAAYTARQPVAGDALPGDLRWKLDHLRPSSCGIASLTAEEWDYVRAALAARQPVGQEPVAVVGPDFALLWAGHGPISPIVERHGIKVGSQLYTAPPAPAAVPVDVRELIAAARDAAAVLQDRGPGYQETARRLYAALATHPQSAADCARCSGSGEDPEGFYDQTKGPDGETHDGPCRSCNGTGDQPAAAKDGDA